jgi:polyhydroxyalkanoate synthesis regulator phasin
VKISKTAVLPLAALLVVGAAGAVLATSSGPAGQDVTTVQPAAESPSPSLAPGWNKTIEDTALADVLDDLVAKGTITAAQKTAILDALVAEKQARRAERQAQREQMRTFLADGVITQEEFDQLPADSPLRQAAGLMDDGKITLDELSGLGRGFMGGRGGMHGFGGHGFGKGFGPGGTWGTPDATPAPDAQGSSS